MTEPQAGGSTARAAQGTANGARHSGLGVPILLASTVGFSLSNNLAGIAYEQGMDAAAVMFARTLAMCLVIALWVALGRHRLRYDRRTLGKMWLLGLFFAVINLCFLLAIDFISVSLAVLLLYLGPILVGLLSAALGYERLTPLRIAAAVIAFGGLAVALDITGGDIAVWGLVAGLGTAVGFAINVVGSARMMVRLPQAPVIFHMMVTVLVVSVLVLALAGGGAWPKDATGWWALVAVCAAFSFSIATFYYGIAHTGGTRGALIMNTEPVLTILIAVVFLAEVLAPWQYLGAALVIAAVFMVTLEKPRG